MCSMKSPKKMLWIDSVHEKTRAFKNENKTAIFEAAEINNITTENEPINYEFLWPLIEPSVDWIIFHRPPITLNIKFNIEFISEYKKKAYFERRRVFDF